MKILAERGCSFTTAAERKIAPVVIQKLSYIGLDHDTEHKSPAQNNKAKSYEPQTETSSLSALNVSTALKYYSSQIASVKDPAESTTLLSSTTRGVTLTSARICTAMSCRQVARSCSK